MRFHHQAVLANKVSPFHHLPDTFQGGRWPTNTFPAKARIVQVGPIDDKMSCSATASHRTGNRRPITAEASSQVTPGRWLC
jgi:hypothetical protein